MRALPPSCLSLPSANTMPHTVGAPQIQWPMTTWVILRCTAYPWAKAMKQKHMLFWFLKTNGQVQDDFFPLDLKAQEITFMFYNMANNHKQKIEFCFPHGSSAGPPTRGPEHSGMRHRSQFSLRFQKRGRRKIHFTIHIAWIPLTGTTLKKITPKTD